VEIARTPQSQWCFMVTTLNLGFGSGKNCDRLILDVLVSTFWKLIDTATSLVHYLLLSSCKCVPWKQYRIDNSIILDSRITFSFLGYRILINMHVIFTSSSLIISVIYSTLGDNTKVQITKDVWLNAK